MRYSILICAIECHYSHITRLVCNLKEENPDVEIHLLSSMCSSEIPSEIFPNVEEIIYCQLPKEINIGGIIKKAILTRMTIKKLSKDRRFDVVNIHFPHYYLAGTMPYFRRMSNNIVVSPWGSDILRVDGIRLKMLLNGIINKSDYITGAVSGNIGKKILKYSPKCKSKFRPVYWGSETIDFFSHNIGNIDTQSAKNHFGLSNNYVVTCGYNAFRAQNHDKIIEAIIQIRSQLPDNLKLLFPVSYGGADKNEYIAELKERCQLNHLDALFVENYMPVSDVFMLRMATDIFVHVQNTDAGSASFLEYVLCNKKIVHCAWIHYPMLETFTPLCYHVTPDFSSLADVILETYYSEPPVIQQELVDSILSVGWEKERIKWNELFESIAKIDK